MNPSPADLASLARKYRALAELRRERLRGEPEPEKKVFRELAGRFPGALVELDTLPLDVLDERAGALEVAAGGGEDAPWMAWMHSYHALLRAALQVKLSLARAREVSADRVAVLADRASEEAGWPLDAEFVRAVARPPKGRLVELVWSLLSADFGVPKERMQDALFPRRRARS